MHKQRKLTTIIICGAILLTYSIIGFIQVRIYKDSLTEQVTNTMTYSAAQVVEMTRAKMLEDHAFYQELLDENPALQALKNSNSYQSTTLVSNLRDVLEPKMNEGILTRYGIVSTVDQSIILPNSSGSASAYTFSYEEDTFFKGDGIHILAFNDIIKEEEQQTAFSKAEIMYLFSFDEEYTIIMTQPISTMNTFLDSLPFDFEHHVLIIGYQSTQDKATIYYSDQTFTNPDFLGNLYAENVTSSFNGLLTQMADHSSGIYEYQLQSVSSMIYIDSFLEGSQNHLVITIPNSIITTLVNDLQQTTTILMSVSIFLLFLFLIMIYRFMYRRVNDIHVTRIYNRKVKSYIIIIKKNGIITYTNDLYKRMIAHGKENLMDATFYEGDLKQSIQTFNPFTILFKSKEGKSIYIRFAILKHFHRYELVGTNVTKEVEEIQEMKRTTFVDALTRLPNKTALLTELNEIVLHPNEKTKNVLVLGNISEFKVINELFGRIFGNEVLKEIAVQLQAIIQSSATLYKLEGDEYVLLFKDVPSYAVVLEKVKQMEALFIKTFVVHGNQLKMEMKFGIYQMEKDLQLTAEKMIENARMASSYIKESKRHNDYLYDSNLEMAYIKDDMMAKDLKQAVSKHEFEVYYQPQYSIKEKRIVGFEALLRWQNPTYKDEETIKYIEMAEKSNTIIEIGNFVIQEVFAFVEKMQDYDIRVSLNISPVQIMQVGFVSDLLEQYDRYHLKENSISIEVTETYLISNLEVVIEKLRILKEHGFHIHLDDFGSGYSSMQYLKYLPINAIKIDREFTRNLEIDQYSRVIVSELLTLARELNLYCIVEGVETEAEYQYLNRIKCDIIQGFFIAHAVPQDEAIRLLQEFDLQELLLANKKRKKSKETQKVA